MRISVKGRYALAAAIEMAKNKSRENISTINIASQLGISKIYLEQGLLRTNHPNSPVYTVLEHNTQAMYTQAFVLWYSLCCCSLHPPR
ncbi:MAG: hypothetical protein LBQ16_02190 [Gracilibacteraceae bacterium]|jgi:hypothetical protein|nr:hypothetical protein [Gracilibacteraceae bacterium]